MQKRTNVYIALTEYQLLQALNIATGIYESPKFINKIYIIRNGQRLLGINKEVDWSLNNTKLYILDKISPKELVNEILNSKPSHFFIFQAISAVNLYLGYTLSQKGVEISLGPDGYIMYNVYKKKHPILTFLKNTFKGNKYLIKNKLFNGKIYPFDYYTYGNNKFIDNIWVTHPEQYIHQAKNKVNILKLPSFTRGCIEFIKRCFDFNENFKTENAIYYFNQPFWPELVEIEFNFLKGVLENFPDKDIIVKLHPLTSKETKTLYKAIERLEIIESTVPAEVLLLSLNKCVVFTGWSSVLMTENKTCNYYFNYPIYKNCDVKFLNQSELIVLNHIDLIESPKQMKFPNG